MKHVKLFEEIDQFHWQNDEDRYENLKSEIEDMFETEHTTQEIKDFYLRFKEEVEFLPEEQKRELIELMRNNYKNIRIRKFPVPRRNNDIYVAV